MTAPIAGALLILLALPSCRGGGDRHEHASEHPEGHDHHEQGHGHGDAPVIRITRWTERHELFAEHPPAAAGAPVELLLHLTVLEGFRPLDRGPVELLVDGPAPLRARADAPLRPGIFEVAITPTLPGTYQGRVIVHGDDAAAIGGFEILVGAAGSPPAAGTDDEDAGQVELLKEQQWQLPFATAFALRGHLVPAIEVTGTVTTPPGGSADLGAPTSGRLMAPPMGLPRPGQTVTRGQLLATLAPAPATPEASSRVGLEVAEAEARLAAARAAQARAERLLADEAIPARELDDARREVHVATEGLRAAQRGRSVFAGAEGGSGRGSYRIVSPIAGTVVEVQATPGRIVQPGEVLFRIVDEDELWVSARVPERDAPSLRIDRDAALQVTGGSSFIPLAITGASPTATVVSLGRTIDPATRTIELIYGLRVRHADLRVGGLVRVAVPAGDAFTGIVVARDALVEVGGRPVVYVQVDGEHFVERTVRTGPRSGDRVGILEGLSAGDRVVTRGAHVVRLAAGAKGGERPHGHVH